MVLSALVCMQRVKELLSSGMKESAAPFLIKIVYPNHVFEA